MKFLVDQCLSAELAEGLSTAGHDAVHVSAYEMSRADDTEVLARAAEEDRALEQRDRQAANTLGPLFGSIPLAPPAGNPPS